MKRNKKLLIMVGVLIALGVILAGVFLLRDGGMGIIDKEKILVKSDDGELSVYRNGLVEYKTKEGIFIDNWSIEKTNAFFSYYEENYVGGELADGTGETVYLNGVGYKSTGDELAEVVIGDLTDDGGGDGDDGGGGDDISDYFGTSTPKPSSTPQSGGAMPTPTPGGGGIPSDCLFWRLSYCVKYKPTPTPTPTPASGDAYVIEAADCTEWNETQTTTTVINNTVCVPLE